MQKAYQVLAAQKNISNKKAKEMLDLGLVFFGGKRVKASELVAPSAALKVLKIAAPSVIFEDSEILAVEKAPFFESYDLERVFGTWRLLNRLDKHTSGVVLLTKNEDFRQKCIEEFRQNRVYKEYLALVRGLVAESCVIDKPIFTQKGHFARSVIDFKRGSRALSEVTPLKIIGKNTLVKVVIKTGRTHQIRLHLSSINHPILGDGVYGRQPFARLMLHANKVRILGYEFEAKGGDFWSFLAK